MPMNNLACMLPRFALQLKHMWRGVGKCWKRRGGVHQYDCLVLMLVLCEKNEVEKFEIGLKFVNICVRRLRLRPDWGKVASDVSKGHWAREWEEGVAGLRCLIQCVHSCVFLRMWIRVGIYSLNIFRRTLYSAREYSDVHCTGHEKACQSRWGGGPSWPDGASWGTTCSFSSAVVLIVTILDYWTVSTMCTLRWRKVAEKYSALLTNLGRSWDQLDTCCSNTSSWRSSTSLVLSKKYQKDYF